VREKGGHDPRMEKRCGDNPSGKGTSVGPDVHRGGGEGGLKKNIDNSLRQDGKKRFRGNLRKREGFNSPQE